MRGFIWPSWTQGAFAVRLMAAALGAYGLSASLGFAHGYSAVFSALIVVRPYQQGAWRAAGQRLAATALGIGTAFLSVYLHQSGLNDYALLAIAMAPLSLLVAYDSGYRTAMISALIMLSAGLSVARVPAMDVAIARAVVVATGAVVGIAVSFLVLPQPHHRTVAHKALQIIRLMLNGLREGLDPANAVALDKADGRLRKYLLELGQMARDHKPRNADEDASNRIVGLTRHMQSLSVLLRSEWRRMPLDGKGKNDRCNLVSRLISLLDQLENAARGRAAEIAPPDARGAIGGLESPADAPERWLLWSFYRDLMALESLVSPAVPEKRPATSHGSPLPERR